MTKLYFYHMLYNLPDTDIQEYGYGTVGLNTDYNLLDQVVALAPKGATNIQVTAFNEVAYV